MHVDCAVPWVVHVEGVMTVRFPGFAECPVAGSVCVSVFPHLEQDLV